MTTSIQVTQAPLRSPGRGCEPGMTTIDCDLLSALQKLTTSIKWAVMGPNFILSTLSVQKGQLVQNLCDPIREKETLTQFQHLFFPTYHLHPKNPSGRHPERPMMPHEAP